MFGFDAYGGLPFAGLPDESGAVTSGILRRRRWRNLKEPVPWYVWHHRDESYLAGEDGRRFPRDGLIEW